MVISGGIWSQTKYPPTATAAIATIAPITTRVTEALPRPAATSVISWLPVNELFPGY